MTQSPLGDTPWVAPFGVRASTDRADCDSRVAAGVSQACVGRTLMVHDTDLKGPDAPSLQDIVTLQSLEAVQADATGVRPPPRTPHAALQRRMAFKKRLGLVKSGGCGVIRC